MEYLIDTNVIVRFLVQDDERLFQKSSEIFEKIKKHQIHVCIEPLILAECFYVLTKLYKKDRREVIFFLRGFVTMENVLCDKVLMHKTFTLLEQKSIDFADAHLKAKASLKNHKILSFDKDLL